MMKSAGSPPIYTPVLGPMIVPLAHFAVLEPDRKRKREVNILK